MSRGIRQWSRRAKPLWPAVALTGAAVVPRALPNLIRTSSRPATATARSILPLRNSAGRRQLGSSRTRRGAMGMAIAVFSPSSSAGLATWGPPRILRGGSFLTRASSKIQYGPEAHFHPLPFQKECFMRKSLSRAAFAALACLSMCGAYASLAAADQYDRRIIIVNKSSFAIVEVYASNVGQSRWDYDMLRGGTLSSGDSIIADIDDGTGYCRYDLLAIMKDGTRVTEYNVNACVTEQWTIWD